MLPLPVFLSADFFYPVLSHCFRQSEHLQMPSVSIRSVLPNELIGLPLKLCSLPILLKATKTNGYSGETNIKGYHFLGKAVDEDISLESWKLIFCQKLPHFVGRTVTSRSN